MSYLDFLKSFSLPFYIILTVTAGFFLWGAITLLVAKKDPNRIARGNKILFWTIIGFIAVTFSFLIFTLGGNFIKNRNQQQNQNIGYQEEFPPAPSQDIFPPFEQ